MSAASSKAGLPNDEEDVAEHLTCPVCFNLPEKEVFQCRDGHVLCSKCYFKLKECPQCRGPLDKAHPIRNRHFEDELEKFAQSCLQSECQQPGRQNGRRLYYKRLGSTINLCKFLKHNCNCNFEFNLSNNPKETVNHMVSVHGAKLTKSKEFRMELCNFPGDGNSGTARSTPTSTAEGSILQFYSSVVTNLEERNCYVFSIPVRNISADLFQIASYFLQYSSSLRETAVKPGFKMEYSILKPAGGSNCGSAWKLVVVQDPKHLMEAEELNFGRLSRSLEVSLLKPFLPAEKNLLINCKILLETDESKKNGKEAALESFKCQTTSTSLKKKEATPLKRWHPFSGILAAHELLRDLQDLLSSPGPIPQVAALDMLDLILASALNQEGGYLLEFGKEDFEYILYGAVFKVVELGSLETLKKIMALRDFNWGVVSMIGSTLLQRAMGDKDLNRGVEKAKLLLDKIDPKALDDNHRSLAHYAALSSNGKGVELVCQLVLQVNGKDKMGATPLHLTMKNAKGPEVTVEKVEILLKYGADPEAMDNEGKTPLDVLSATGNENLKERVTRLIKVHGNEDLN